MRSFARLVRRPGLLRLLCAFFFLLLNWPITALSVFRRSPYTLYLYLFSVWLLMILVLFAHGVVLSRRKAEKR